MFTLFLICFVLLCLYDFYVNTMDGVLLPIIMRKVFM